MDPIDRTCIIDGCKSNAEENFNITLHSVPMSRMRRTLWLNSVKKLNNQDIIDVCKNTSSLRFICQNHFKPEDYASVAPRSLKENAVPSLFGDKCYDHSEEIQQSVQKDSMDYPKEHKKQETLGTSHLASWMSFARGGAKCHVQGCKNRRSNCDLTVNFHRLDVSAPDSLLNDWSQFCWNVPYKTYYELTGKSELVVCSQHFETNDFCKITNCKTKKYLKALAVPSIKPQAEVAVAATAPSTEQAKEMQETYFHEDTGEYFVVQQSIDRAGQEEDEYILSDNVEPNQSESTVESGSQEMLMDQSNVYVVEEDDDELVGMYKDTVPPLLTFDGRLVIEEVPESNEVIEILSSQGSTIQSSIHSHSSSDAAEPLCNHRAAYRKLEQENRALEKETKRMTERNGQMASTLRRMRSEVNQVNKCFSPIFTPGQMDRIRGTKKDPWQKRDFERAIRLKHLGTKAYKYLKMHYKFPLPGLNLLSVYENLRTPDLAPIYKEMETFKQRIRNRDSLDSEFVKFRKSIQQNSVTYTTKTKEK